MKLLEVHNLTLAYGINCVVRNVSFDVEKGEALALWAGCLNGLVEGRAAEVVPIRSGEKK